MESFEYKSYSVVTTTATFGGSRTYSPAWFTITRKGEREAVHRGELNQEFATGEAALDAASEAAKVWIDENGD